MFSPELLPLPTLQTMGGHDSLEWLEGATDAGMGPQIRDDVAPSKRREMQSDSKWGSKPSYYRRGYCPAQRVPRPVLGPEATGMGFRWGMDDRHERSRWRRELLKKQIPFPGALPPQISNDALLEEGP